MSDSKPKKGWWRWQNATKYQVSAQGKRKPSNQYPEEDRAAIAIDRLVEDINRHANEERAERQSEKFWHKAEVIGLWAAAFVGVAAIFVGTCDADRQRNIAQRTLDEMQAEQRPWVGAPIKIIPAVGAHDIVSFTLVFDNIGHEPARDFVIDGKIGPGTSISAVERIETDCKYIENENNVGPNKYTIVPGSNWETQLSETPASRDKTYTLSNIIGTQNPIIFGCVRYKIFPDTIRHTGYFGSIKIKNRRISVSGIYAVDAN